MKKAKADIERFSFRKFIQGFNVFDLVSWAKSFVYLFRFFIILGLVVGIIFGVGYFKGRKNAPVKVDMADTKIILIDPDGDNHELVIKNGAMKFDGRPVEVGDIPSLKPYGIELRPKAVAGITSAGNPTAGAALEFAHFYRFNAEILALYQFLGIGISYDLHLDGPIKIDNSSLGLGIGRDFDENDTAVLLYYTIKF